MTAITHTDRSPVFVVDQQPEQFTLLRGLLLAALDAADMPHAEALARAIGRLREALRDGKIIVQSFDGAEMRCSSASRGNDIIHVTTHDACTCEGGRHPWCIHRVLLRLLFIEWGLMSFDTLARSLAVVSDAPAKARNAPDVWTAADAAYYNAGSAQFGYED